MPQSEKEQLTDYLEQSERDLDKLQDDFFNGLYTPEQAAKMQADIEADIALWKKELLLLHQVKFLGDILGINTDL